MCLIQDTRQNHDWLMRVFPPDTRFHAVIIRYELSYWSLSSLFSLDRSLTDSRKSSFLTLSSMLSSAGTSYPIAWPLSSRFSLDRMWERSLRILGYSILLSYWQLSAFSSVIGQKLRWVARLHNAHEIQSLFLGTSSFFGHSYSRSHVMITRPQFSNWPPPLFLILWYFS